ncbi:MAG TPA: hypothetical protein VKV32_07790 [Stellaceae bacterium]|nr:hypothetical protein [Stellaceae bacterium]
MGRFDEQLGRVIDGQVEIRERLGLLEQQYASLSRRIDGIEAACRASKSASI